MECGQTEVEIDTIPEEQAREELERLLANRRFKVAERNRHFLRYITDARYDSCSQGIKSYSIAVDVFGRPASFDSQNDPIVRIEANRLRSGLDQFYEAYGEPGGLRIDIPKGRYVPRFTRIPEANAVSVQGMDDEDAVPDVAPVQAQSTSIPPGWRLAAVATVLTAVTIAGVAQLPLRDSPQTALVRKPTVSLTMVDESLEPIHDRLLVALSRFDTVRMVGEPQKASEGEEGSYAVRLKAVDGQNGRGVWWQITDVRSSEVIKTGLELATLGERDDEIVSALARQIAATRGIIGRAESARADAIGNPCILRAETTMDEGQFSELGTVRACLMATIAANPDDPDAAATLSRFLIVSRRDVSDTNSVDRAHGLATRALMVSPGSDRAMIAMMFSQFAVGQTDAAIRTGQQAVEGNPDNLELAAKVGLFMIYAGRWEEGAAVAERASATTSPPRAAILALGLDAYRRGDFVVSLAMSERINCGDILVRALRVASSALLGRVQGEARYAATKRTEPEFEKDLLASLAARHVDSNFARSLANGVRVAGAAITEEQVAGL